ncbi:protein of unknown function [Magnetospirillum sp. XM-1]|nr:protein of unknown function [Magnetospirillum sp. XM-1]
MRLNDFTISPENAVSVAPGRLPPVYDENLVRFEVMAVLDLLRGALHDAQRLLDLIDRVPTSRL